MSTVTTYKTLGANLSDICNTVNQSYCGDITTGYTQSGTDVGTILTQTTFSTVAGSITACGYNANINQYNTGQIWNSTYPTTNDTRWGSASMSSSGQYCLAIRNFGGDPIFYSNNYGQNWTATSSVSTTWYSVSISGSGLRGIACGGTGTNSKIYYSIDTGSGLSIWLPSNVPSGTPSLTWGKVSMSRSGKYCLAGMVSGLLYISSNSGLDWTASSISGGIWPGLSISGEGQYAIACQTNNSNILYSYDYGNTWNTSNSNLGRWCLSISSSGQYCIAANRNATVAAPQRIYRSTDYGQTWNITSSPRDTYLEVSISASGQYAMAGSSLAYGGTIVTTYNYGQSWYDPVGNTPFYASWTAVAISGSGKYAIAGNTGTSGFGYGGIYYSINSSTTYLSKDLTTVFEPLYKYNTWSLLTGVTGGGGIATSNLGNIVINSSSFGITYYSTDYGSTWNISTGTDANTFRKIVLSNTGQYVFAGTQGVGASGEIYYSTNYGQTWAIFSGRPASNIAMSSSGITLAYCLGADVYVSKNSGTTWTITNLIYPGTQLYCLVMAMSSSGQYIITMGNSDTFEIYYSSNYGASFNYTNVSPPVSTIWVSVSMSSSGQYAIACSRGAILSVENKIYYSTNFGVNWTESNSPLSLYWWSVSMSDSGQYAIASTYNFINTSSIYYSNNYGVDWTLTNITTLNANWVSISGNGQYTFTTIASNNTVYKCTATN
jgi:photosystem II stability/assembly factor-like uncharacterized protein